MDEVKFYPSSAQMATYTYKPFAGLSSATNENNKSTYYDYDAYSRLQLIRDNDRNILKQFNYNFVNPSFFSEEMTTEFTKNDCDISLYLGSKVNYTVPVGSYTSNVSVQDANTKRDAEINARGQAYANAKGYCWNYQNQKESKDFVRQCAANLYGTHVEYIVPAGKYSSIISLADAQNKAKNDINANGQNNANIQGACWTYDQVFKNAVRDEYIKRNNCPFGYRSSNQSGTHVIIPYAKYLSTISQADAESQAAAEILAWQDQANQNETCVPIPNISVQVSNSTHYDMTISFYSSVYGATTYTAIHDQTYGTVSLPEGTYNISISSPTRLNFNFYVGGVRKQGSYASYSNVQLANISITN